MYRVGGVGEEAPAQAPFMGRPSSSSYLVYCAIQHRFAEQQHTSRNGLDDLFWTCKKQGLGAFENWAGLNPAGNQKRNGVSIPAHHLRCYSDTVQVTNAFAKSLYMGHDCIGLVQCTSRALSQLESPLLSSSRTILFPFQETKGAVSKAPAAVAPIVIHLEVCSRKLSSWLLHLCGDRLSSSEAKVRCIKIKPWEPQSYIFAPRPAVAAWQFLEHFEVQEY